MSIITIFKNIFMLTKNKSRQVNKFGCASSPYTLLIFVKQDYVEIQQQIENLLLLSPYIVIACFDKNKLHCFSAKSQKSISDIEEIDYSYVYFPSSIDYIKPFQLVNLLVLLNIGVYDFITITRSLDEFPHLYSKSESDVFVFRRGLDLESLSSGSASGFFLRLPIENDFQYFCLTNILSNAKITSNRYIRLGNSEIFPPSIIPRKIISHIKKKKIVFVFPIFMAVGGVERNTIEIMRQLSNEFDFVVITMERLNKEHGSLHYQLDGICDAYFELAELTIFEHFLPTLENLKEIYDPDLIWVCNGSPWFSENSAQIRSLFATIPIVDQQVYDTREGWINHYHKKGIQSFDRFIAINSKIQDVFIKKYGIDTCKIDLIYPALRGELFDIQQISMNMRGEICRKYGLPEDKRIFAFVGRLTSQKNPYDYLEFVKHQISFRDSYHFLMIGSGPLETEVEEYIEKYDLKNITRISYVSEMNEVYSVTDGLVIVSKYEGLPIAMLEALAMGNPVLSTDVGDIEKVVSEYQVGLIIPEIGNVDVICKTFDQFLELYPQFKNNAIANAQRIKNRFSSKTISEQYSDCFLKAVKAKV